jgi:hypothetical protein
VDNVRPFVFFHNLWNDFVFNQILHFIRHSRQRNKTVFSFSSTSLAPPHLIVKHGAFGRNKSLVLIDLRNGRL